MSLLMDALKKAEQAKRQGEPGSDMSFSDLSEGLSLAIVDPPQAPAGEPAASTDDTDNAGANGLPKLPSEMADLDQQFLATHTSAPPEPKRRSPPSEPEAPSPHREPGMTATAGNAPEIQAPRNDKPTPSRANHGAQTADNGARQTVGNAFAAKNTTPAGKNRAFAIGIGVATLLATLGIGGYFWWQLQPKSAFGPLQALPQTTPLPIAAAPVPATTSATSVATPPAVQAPGPAAAVPVGAASPAPSLVTAAPANNGERTTKETPPAPTRRNAAKSDTPAAEPVTTSEPVRVSKTPLRVNPAIARGFENFQQGQLAEAKKEYDRVLKAEPQNTDALHGLAAIALRDGRTDLAEYYFQRILVSDPQDAIAFAGLMNSRGKANPAVAESRLKAISASQPELAAPHFALGNLFAAQERWQEAQQAYFKAYSVDAGNPDVLFNLAVSLEHLRQPKLATQYYGLAIEAARRQSAGFDPAQAESRLRALQP